MIKHNYVAAYPMMVSKMTRGVWWCWWSGNNAGRITLSTLFAITNQQHSDMAARGEHEIILNKCIVHVFINEMSISF